MPKARILTAIIDAKGTTIAEIERRLGYANSGLRKAIERDSDLKSDKIDKLLSVYPDLNPEWVFRGEGEMLQTVSGEQLAVSGEQKAVSGGLTAESEAAYRLPLTAYPKENATDMGRPIAIHTTRAGNEFVELSGGRYMMYTKLVPKKAAAGYLVGWGDEEFLGDLPIHPVVVKELHKGTYRTFEASGDSMNDGTSQSIDDGDLITGRQISRSLWKHKFHMKKYADYVIVHHTEGIVVKRISNHDTELGIITCQSLNKDKKKYPDFTLRLDECLQIFNIVIVTKPR